MGRLRITRREWVAAMGAPVAASSQVAAPGQTPDQLLTEVAGELRKAAAQLEEFKLPMEAEPAFVFKP